jgi:hypothetical protein
MRCLAFVVMLLSAGAAGAAWYTQQSSSEWQDACSHLERERQRGRQLDAQLGQRHVFAVFCDKQLFDVLIGKKRLVEACREIERYAAVHWPAFLEQIEALGEGRTPREKLAHNLAGFFVVRRSEHGGWQREPALALRMALELSEAITTP